MSREETRCLFICGTIADQRGWTRKKKSEGVKREWVESRVNSSAERECRLGRLDESSSRVPDVGLRPGRRTRLVRKCRNQISLVVKTPFVASNFS